MPDLALHGYSPRTGNQAFCLSCRGILIRAEFVEIVVVGDVLERGHLLIRAKTALLHTVELCSGARFSPMIR